LDGYRITDTVRVALSVPRPNQSSTYIYSQPPQLPPPFLLPVPTKPSLTITSRRVVVVVISLASASTARSPIACWPALLAMDRSKSYAGGRMQIEPYYGGGGGGGGGARADFRSYSYSAGGTGPSSYSYNQYEYGGPGAGEEEVKRSKSKRRWLADPDMDRKRRVAAYKAYGVEGRVKGSLRKSFRWVKDRYLDLVYGWS
jgi:hypothetical protein